MSKNDNTETVEKVHDMVLNNCRIKVHEIAETIGISKEHVRDILHEGLQMKKLCTRCACSQQIKNTCT